MKTDKKTAGTRTFQPHEEQFVRTVAALASALNEKRYEIGKLTHELIQKCGGVAYGEATLRRIAQHPKLACTEQQLRRYLAYYRLFDKYGDVLSKKFPRLPDSAYYQLARVLSVNLPAKEEKAKIVACANEAIEQNMTVEQIAQMVSSKLGLAPKSESNSGKPDTLQDASNEQRPEPQENRETAPKKMRPETTESHESVAQPQPNGNPETTSRQERLAKVLLNAEEAVTQLSQNLPPTGSVAETKLRGAVAHLLTSLVDLAGHLAVNCSDSDFTVFLAATKKRLDRVVSIPQASLREAA